MVLIDLTPKDNNNKLIKLVTNLINEKQKLIKTNNINNRENIVNVQETAFIKATKEQIIVIEETLIELDYIWGGILKDKDKKLEEIYVSRNSDKKHSYSEVRTIYATHITKAIYFSSKKDSGLSPESKDIIDLTNF